jgi:methionine-rich copper-binding protein CopC
MLLPGGYRNASPACECIELCSASLFGVAFRPMRIAPVFAGWLLVLASPCALAHAHLAEAQPADGSVLTAAPGSLTLRFSESARLTALWIARDGGARQKITPLPESAQEKIVVALPALSPGAYVISWRALSADGHVVPGQIRFTLKR